MSVQYQKEIYSDGKKQLFINFTGLSAENESTPAEFGVTLYALNVKTLEHIFSASLDYGKALDLFNHLNSVSILRHNSKTHTGKFVEVTADLSEVLQLLGKIDGSIVKTIFDKAGDGKKLRLIVEALSASEIHNLHASLKQAVHQKALADLRKLLELEAEGEIVNSIMLDTSLSEYVAGQPEKIFQTWIEKNLWALGTDFVKRHPAKQIGLKSESDLIMETTDGFIDLIELKRPKLKLFEFDDSHKSWFCSKDLSKVLGQCMKYLKVLDNYKLNLEREHKFKLLRPRIKIIAGRSKDFTDDESEALRMLNSVLNHIQVITYDYLYRCGESIISHYTQPATITADD
jgi:Shedu protein SduA, C-terminal